MPLGKGSPLICRLLVNLSTVVCAFFRHRVDYQIRALMIFPGSIYDVLSRNLEPKVIIKAGPKRPPKIPLEWYLERLRFRVSSRPDSPALGPALQGYTIDS